MRRLACAAAAVVALCTPAAAFAHATLVRSEPASGAVVGRSPGEISLVFDDIVRRGPGIAAVRTAGGSVLGGTARTSGKTLTIPLRQGLGNGDYTVRWSVFSDDGHLIQGIVTFAVGKGRAPPVAALGVERRSPVGAVVARWAFLLGLLAAAGLASIRLVVWHVSRAAVAIALALAASGGGALLLVSGAGTGTRFGLAVAVAAILAAAGALAALLDRREADWLALALLPIPAVAGHALDPGLSPIQLGADLVHLAAVAVWLGALVTLALGGVPASGRRRLAQLAVGAVIVLTAAGVVRAYGELAAWHDLWSTGYGRAILVKSGLLLVLGVLGASNRRALRRPLVLAEVALLVGAIAAVGYLTSTRPPRTPLVAPAQAATPRGPALLPAAGVLTLGRRSGARAVALTRRADELTVDVIGGDGLGVDALHVSVAGSPTRPCGPGCYRTTLHTVPPTVEVVIAGARVEFPLPPHPHPAAAIVRRASATIRSAASVVYRERLSSGTGAALDTLWREESPNRYSYAIRGGPSAIVIGSRRYDRTGKRWIPGPQQPLPFPATQWQGRVTNAFLLHEDARTQDVAFIDRGIPAWFTIHVDRRTGRLRSLEMIATAHFMRHDYLGYDEPRRIFPPR